MADVEWVRFKAFFSGKSVYRPSLCLQARNVLEQEDYYDTIQPYKTLLTIW